MMSSAGISYVVQNAEETGITENRGNDFGTPFRVRSMADDYRPFFFLSENVINDMITFFLKF